jgi:hypothetical protein
MESIIKLEMPKKQFYDKKNYEPLLLECLNRIPFFIEKSGGGFYAPKSESNGQCDAIGKNGCYSVDFKLLLSQEGAQNVNETSLTKVTLCKGVTMSAPSKASMRGESSLPFPNIWGFLVSHSFSLNENNEIVLADKAAEYMKDTIMSLNKMICTKKNLLFFHPSRLVIQDSHNNPIEVLRNRAKEALSIVSKARRKLSPGYETYYALLTNNEVVLLFEDFTYAGFIELTSLVTWHKLHIKL